MVSMLVFRSEDGWFKEPGLGRHAVSFDKKIYATLSFSTQVYKWVPAI